nr:response regulator [Actinomycetota bacterium]
MPTETLASTDTLSPAETLAPSARRVLLVDSRDNRRQLMRLVVSGNDAKAVLVGEADSQAAALAMVEQEHADVVVLDVQMPVSDGLTTITALRERYPELAIIVCSFDLDPSTVQQVLEAGADSCLAKPVNRTDIHKALNELPPRSLAWGDVAEPSVASSTGAGGH